MVNRWRIGKIALLQYFLIYLTIISSRACLYDTYKTFFVYLMFGIGIFLPLKIPKLRDTKIYITIVLLFLSLTITRFLNNGGLWINYIIMISSVILCAYYSFKIEEKNFLERYLRVVFFFSIVSLLCTIILLILPSLRNVFPGIETGYFGGTRGVLFYSFQYKSWERGFYRNNGIFTEPGIFQIPLSVAIYFILFNGDSLKLPNKKKIYYLTVFLLTLLSTQSTTGYISLILILVGFLSTKKDFMKKRIWKVMVVFIIFLIGDYLIFGESSFIYQNLIAKVMDLSTGQLDLNISTGKYRMNGISAGFNIFLSSPFFGCGDNYHALLNSYLIDTTSSGGGIVYFLASCGLVGTLILCNIIIRRAYINKKNLIGFITYFLLWINTGMAQAEIVYGCLLLIAFYNSVDDCEKQQQIKRKIILK